MPLTAWGFQLLSHLTTECAFGRAACVPPPANQPALKLSTTLLLLVLGGTVAVARGGTGVLGTAVAVAGGLVGTCVGVLVGGGVVAVAVAVAVSVAVGEGVGVSVAMNPDSLAGSRFDWAAAAMRTAASLVKKWERAWLRRLSFDVLSSASTPC
jgi:hypothetical protein